MNFSIMDKLNLVVGTLTVGGFFSGMLNLFYVVSVVVLIIVWFSYHQIPWAHKKWKTETILDSVNKFYSYSKVLHSIIVFSLAGLIGMSLIVGVATKSGPGIVASDTAEYIWNDGGWKTKVIESQAIPKEFKSIKRDDQPYALIIEKTGIKAVSLRETLSVLAGRYSSIYGQLAGVVFFFILVTGMVLFPTEMLAEARNRKEGL